MMISKRNPGDLLSSKALLTAREAGALCGKSAASWRRLDRAGLVPAGFPLGNQVLYRKSDVLGWIEAGLPIRSIWENLCESNAQG